MRKEHLPHLVDPINHKPLTLTSFLEEDGQIMAGYLENKESWYPIIDGVPRILIGDLRTNLFQQRYKFFAEWKEKLPKQAQNEWQSTLDAIADFDKFIIHQKKTGESFAYEWKYIYRENNYEKQNFFHFLSPYLEEKSLKGKLTVDIGCGSGRFTKQAALAGAQISYGTDLGESVEVAFALTKELPNVCIVQADIYAMPFQNSLDIAFSIGVLHHLPEPQNGFSRLPDVLKPGGQMLIWVYNRRNNNRALYLYEPMRSALKHIPKPLLFRLGALPAGVVQACNYVTVGLNKAGLKKAAKKVPFSYYANFPFNMKLNDAFDVLATPKSNYYYVEQIEKWFSDAKLTQIKAYEHPEAGITCIGNRH